MFVAMYAIFEQKFWGLWQILAWVVGCDHGSCVEFVLQELMSFIRSYVVPDGFPDSVTPSYVPYMTWRALKVIFLISWTIV